MKTQKIYVSDWGYHAVDDGAAHSLEATAEEEGLFIYARTGRGPATLIPWYRVRGVVPAKKPLRERVRKAWRALKGAR